MFLSLCRRLRSTNFGDWTLSVLFLFLSCNGIAGDFDDFVKRYRPDMPANHRVALKNAIWKESGYNYKMASTVACIALLESSLQVRAWEPKVKQNTDYLGAHNTVLYAELKRRGLVAGNSWKTDKKWPVYKAFFKRRPDIGTGMATAWFAKGAVVKGIDNQVQIWKTGKVGDVNGLAYLMQVRSLRNEHFKKGAF